MSHADHIRQYIELYIDFIWEDAVRARLFDYLDNTPLITLSETIDIFGPFFDHSIQMLQAAQAEGTLNDTPPRLMASFVRGAIRNTLKRRRLNADPLTATERQQIAAMCWNAIAARS